MKQAKLLREKKAIYYPIEPDSNIGRRLKAFTEKMNTYQKESVKLLLNYALTRLEDQPREKILEILSMKQYVKRLKDP
jgi:hypothetical protein